MTSRPARSLRLVVAAALAVGCGGDTPAGPSASGPDRIAFVESVETASMSHTGTQLSVIHRDGSGHRTLTPATSFVSIPQWAARAGRVAYRLDRDTRVHVATEAGDVLATLDTHSELLPFGGDFRLSPDGTRLTYVTASPSDGSRLMVRSVAGGAPAALSPSAMSVGYGAWSPDGAWIAFTENGALWRVRPDGSGRSLVSSLHAISSYAWSADGGRLAVVASDDVWVMDADGSDARRLTGADRPVSSLGTPTWSPDGRYLAGQELGLPPTYDLLVVRVSDGGLVARMPRSASLPDWSPDGSRLVYVKFVGRQLVTVARDGTDEEVIRSGPIGSPRWLR